MEYWKHKNAPKSIAILEFISQFEWQPLSSCLGQLICFLRQFRYASMNSQMEQEKWEIFRILFQISFVIRICYRNVKMCIHSRFWMSLVNTFNLMQECYTVLYSILCFFCQQSVKRLIKLRICEPFQQSVWSVDCYFLRLPFPTVIKKKK